MASSFPPKDPDEVLDYEVSWAPRIPTGDAISESIWIIPDGITKDSDTHGATSTTIWLSGGTLNSTYALLNRITTVEGRVMDKTISIKIKTK